MRVIESEADIAAGVAFLRRSDPRLLPVMEVAGPVPLRRRVGGFEGLAAVIMGQQISTGAAAAIWARLRASVEPFTPEQFLLATEEQHRAAGLSGAKVRTLTGVAGACRDGFDLDHLATLPATEAITSLTSMKGIGPWTAEIYLLFCLGHPDIFPAGDLALQEAVRDAFNLPERPADKPLRLIAQAWSPWRGVAARLFWAYYKARRGRTGIPV